jgi:hypothetical protein
MANVAVRTWRRRKSSEGLEDGRKPDAVESVEAVYERQVRACEDDDSVGFKF